MNHYSPGLHLIGNITNASLEAVSDMRSCQMLIDAHIAAEHLQKVGEVYHAFDGGGFTTTVCLTESHIAIHTWPEYRRVTYDVFLSNFMHVNDEKGQRIFEALHRYFGGDIHKTELRR